MKKWILFALMGLAIAGSGGCQMMRAIDQHRLVPVVDKVFAFEQLKEAMERLKRGAHFGKICIQH